MFIENDMIDIVLNYQTINCDKYFVFLIFLIKKKKI